jgi:hypothetical protein
MAGMETTPHAREGLHSLSHRFGIRLIPKFGSSASGKSHARSDLDMERRYAARFIREAVWRPAAL